MVEYLKDAIETDPGEAFPTQTLESGVQFTKTGDETVDAWEKDIAQGKSPDFSKAFTSDADKKLFEAWLTPKKQTATPVKTPDELLDEELPDWVKDASEGFADDYSKEK